MSEAPDLREQGDCPTGEACSWACDQHEVCGLCGKKATGSATIGDTRYCHGDDDPGPTCYERAQWTASKSADVFRALAIGDDDE